MGNTFEQYAGLISFAASRFSVRNINETQKGKNRAFSRFEQYGRLESRQSRDLANSGGQE